MLPPRARSHIGRTQPIGLTPPGSSLTRPAARPARRRPAARRRPGAGPDRGGRRARRAGSRAGRRRATSTSASTARLRAHEPRHDGALHRDRAAQPGDQLLAVPGRRADRRHPLAEPLVADRVGLGQQRAGAQQPVGQRLERRAALASELEPPQRPRQLARARRAAGDERAERAQRVLLLGREQAVAGRAAQAGGERDREPWRAVRARPCGRPEGGLGVVPQPQRRLEPAQPAARLLQARSVARFALEREDGDGGVLVAAQLRRRVLQRRRRGRA